MKHLPLVTIFALTLVTLLAGCASAGGADERQVDPSGATRDEEGRLVPAVAESARERMYQLVQGGPSLRERVLATMVTSGEEYYIPVLLEAYRMRQLGRVMGSPEDYVTALEALSGEAFGMDWAAWVVWYGTTDIEPPPGFIGWKGRLLSRIDPGFAIFLRDGVPSRRAA